MKIFVCVYTAASLLYYSSNHIATAINSLKVTLKAVVTASSPSQKVPDSVDTMLLGEDVRMENDCISAQTEAWRGERDQEHTYTHSPDWPPPIHPATPSLLT